MSIRHINLKRLGLAGSVALLMAATQSTPCWSQMPNPGVRPIPPAATGGAIERLPPGPPAARSPAPPTQLPPSPSAPSAYPPTMTPAGAQPHGAVWTLAQLVQIAEQSNPSMAKAQGQIQSAQGLAVQAGLYPNPTFDSNTPEQFAGQFSNMTTGFFQEVVVKGKKRMDRAAAREAAVQVELAYVKARFDALTEIRSQFYSVLASERRLALQWELVGIAAATKQAAEQRVKAFVGTETEVLLLTIELQNAEIDASNYQTELEGARQTLAATVGIPELPIAGVQGDLYGRLPEFDEAALQQFILAENSEVQSAKIDVNRNRLLLRRAEVEPYPNVSAGPCYYGGTDPKKVFQQFGIQVTFPLAIWDRNQGNILSQQGELRASTANVGLVQNNLLGEAANTLAEHRAAREMAVSIGRDILPSSQRTLQLTRSGFDGGLLDISTLLQAQRSLIETNKDLIDALENAWTTGAELAGLVQMEQFP